MSIRILPNLQKRRPGYYWVQLEPMHLKDASSWPWIVAKWCPGDMCWTCHNDGRLYFDHDFRKISRRIKSPHHISHWVPMGNILTFSLLILAATYAVIHFHLWN